MRARHPTLWREGNPVNTVPRSEHAVRIVHLRHKLNEGEGNNPKQVRLSLRNVSQFRGRGVAFTDVLMSGSASSSCMKINQKTESLYLTLEILPLHRF